MNVGVINESGKIENRAGLTPSSVSLLVEKAHTVKVLSNLVSPWLLEDGDMGIDLTLKKNRSLARGVYIHRGNIVRKTITERFRLAYRELFTFK